MTKKKRTARTRLSRGVFVSLCLVATIVLAVGTGIFSQRALEQQVLSDNSGTNLSESVAEVNIAEEEQPEPLEITSDAEYGDYEKGKVLVAVDETTDTQHLDEVLATSDLVETKSVSDQDISGGFVRVDINGDVPIKQILSELKDEGFAAQPNYIYYPAEDEVTSSAVSVNDPSSSNQWLLESVDAYRAWEIAKCKEDVASSPKVSVAVIDTGYGEIDAYHALQVLSAEIANDQVMGEQPVELEIQGADGIAADVSEWQWESSDPNILTVDNTAGTATAIGSGTATLTATHKKLASRTLSKQVSVDAAGLEEKIDLSDSTAISASIDSGQAFAYTGQEARPSVTVKTKDGKTLKEGTDYTLEYANNISASVNTVNKKARVVVMASSTSGVYTGSVELYFTIDQADISSATIDPIADQKYTGSAIVPTPVVKVNGSTLSAIDYTVSYKNNTNVGTATLVVTGKGNYKGTKEATFKIAQDQGSTSTSSSTESQSKVITVPATYTYNPTTHPQTLTATVTYDSNFNKGQKARFTYNISGNKRPLVYKLNSFEIETSSGWSPLVDITRGEYGSFNTKNYFEEALYTPGNYRLSFLVAEYTANADGTKTLGDMQRFQINFTVAESDNFKSIETIVAEVVAQCEQECANSKGTSSYDYDRALWLNDWLVENTKYDSSLMYCSAEGVFNRGLGTCEGYHEAYAMLLNKAGIESVGSMTSVMRMYGPVLS